MTRVILIVFYQLFTVVISGLSTTNVQRLLKGAKRGVMSGSCQCDHCGKTLHLWEQIPVLSYVLSKGRCRSCGAAIPGIQTWQEAGIIAAFTAAGVMTGYEPWAVLIDFGLYELYKILAVIVKKPREKHFRREMLLSLAAELLMFGAVFGFLFAVRYWLGSV